MKAFHDKSASRIPGLLIAGMVAAACGLALSASGSSSSSSASEKGAATGSSGQYGMPSSDTGMSPSAKGSAGRSGAGTAALPPNVTPGWKIRVCSEKTKADQISFKFMPDNKGAKAGTGAAGSASTGMGGSGSANPANDPAVIAALSEQTATWSRGEATEIKLPSGLRDAERIRVEASPSQKDKSASVCLIYNDHVAKKLNFDDREVSMAKSTDNGECGC